MKFAYHPHCVGKPEKRANNELWSNNRRINLGYGWITTKLEFEEIYELISVDGIAIAPALSDEHRTESNFVSSEIAMVDIDGGMTIEQLKAHPFYQLYGSGFYTTPSHTNSNPRFRIIYKMPCPITDPEAMRIVYEGLMMLHGSADVACKDSARLFYGTVNAQHREITNRSVDEEGVAIICKAYDIAQAERAQQIPMPVKDTRVFETADIVEVELLLDDLKKHYDILEYHQRRDVCWAVMSVLSGSDAVSVMRARWPDGSLNGKYEAFVKGYKRSDLHLGTIVIMIRRCDNDYRKRTDAAIGSATAKLAKKMLEKLK